MTVELIFVGDNFYMQSTIMSPIYTPDWQRYDWGLVARDLRDGKEVHIRPASPEEMSRAYMRLAVLKEKS